MSSFVHNKMMNDKTGVISCYQNLIWRDTHYLNEKNARQEGRMHGVGEMTWPSGDKYIGDWDQDNRQGFGLYLYASGNRYKGSYVGNKKEGYGQFWWTTGRNAGRDEM